ncbi:hypothetical protein H4R33_001204 [Dimargaris cristalligena]|nr:hypothetical protein H4R33_001204 [Dimargaris cristalligena]
MASRTVFLLDATPSHWTPPHRGRANVAHDWLLSVKASNVHHHPLDINQRNLKYQHQLNLIMARRHIAVRLHYLDYDVTNLQASLDNYCLAATFLYDPRGLVDETSGEPRQKQYDERAVALLQRDKDESMIAFMNMANQKSWVID